MCPLFRKGLGGVPPSESSNFIIPSNQRILITGSQGLIGSSLSSALEMHGCEVVHFDLKLPASKGYGDICSLKDVLEEARCCDGIVHLAAVSRVVWGERDPELCWLTNAGGTKNVLQAAALSPQNPWVLVASSREVYGQPERLPANEDSPYRPINIYGRAKVQGEQYAFLARESGLQTAVVRLSNVYGSTKDHPDRVVPAFTRAAAFGEILRVDGGGNTFDFTYIDDVTDGLLRIIHLLHDGELKLPPIHLVTGRPTTLKQLAELAITAGDGKSFMVEAPSRNYDVARFYGDPSRAREILGWEASTSIETGVSRMVAAYSDETRKNSAPVKDQDERRLECASSK